MSDIAIKVEKLSKRYRIGQSTNGYKTLRETLAGLVTAPFRQKKSRPTSIQKIISNSTSALASLRDDEIWALKDVSFEVKSGEVVGIIGRNGAGKSTLLKILSRITEPTEGHAQIHARVGSLLEVGTGFHAELTGRENIYLSGAILGMKKREIDRKFDEIVAFAEVERFLDTPVKHYSSGMYVRVAFAVAAHLEPEILLVDEVLAVGDASFQKKCLGKMGDVAGEGRTVLFVSHNMAAVENLCSRALWLDKGRVSNQGHTDLVICEYLQTTTTSCVKQVWPDWNTAPGNGKIRLRSAQIRTDNGTNPSQITTNMAVSIEITYWNLKPDVQLNLSLLLFNQEGICVLASTNAHDPKWPAPPFPVGIFRSICSIPGGLLNAGLYRIKLLVVKDSAIILYHHEDVLVFEVHDSGKGRGGWYGKWPGVIRPNLQWSTELLTDKLLTDRTQ